MTSPRPSLLMVNTEGAGQAARAATDPDTLREASGAGKRPDHPFTRQVIDPTGDDDDMPGRWVPV